MTHRVQDWISAYIDSLLRERKSSAIAGEAATDEEALLAREARRLKYQAREGRIVPRPEFVASLEKELRRELAEARPTVRPLPFWRRSWTTALGGMAAAAAVLMLFFLLRSAAILPGAPAAAPAPSLTRKLEAQATGQEARAPAALATPAPPAAAPTPLPATKAAGAAAKPAPLAPARPLAEVVAGAQTIFLGQVAEVSAPAPPVAGEASPASSGVQVVLSVERFLKGPLPGSRVTLRASPGSTFSRGERVLVMARDVNGDGVLDALDYPRSKGGVGAERQVAPGAADVKRSEAEQVLTLEELVRQVEEALRQQ